MINHVVLNGIEVSIGVNYDECPTLDGLSTTKTYSIQDIGDLSFCDAYQTYSAKELKLRGEIILYQNANFELLVNDKSILSFQNGELL